MNDFKKEVMGGWEQTRSGIQSFMQKRACPKRKEFLFSSLSALPLVARSLVDRHKRQLVTNKSTALCIYPAEFQVLD